MYRTIIIPAIFLLLLSSSVFGQNNTQGLSQSASDFIPISPISYEFYTESDTSEITDSTLSSHTNNATHRDVFDVSLLPNESVSYYVLRANEAVGTDSEAQNTVSFGLAGPGNYVVYIDYSKFTVVPKVEENGCMVHQKVGVGTRITMYIQVMDGELALSNLVGLGMAADHGQVSGTIHTSAMGMSSAFISSLVGLPTQISSSSIQHVLQSVGIIKSQLYMNESTLSPQIIAVQNLGCT